MRMPLFVSCAAALLALPFGSVASAATYAYTASQTNVSLTPGQTAAVSFFLTETLASGETTSLIESEDGLYGFDILAQIFSTTAGTPVKIMSSNDVVVNPEFNTDYGGANITLSPQDTGVEFLGTVDILAEPPPEAGVLGTAAGSVRTIYLGDVTFTAGSEGTTVYQLLDGPTSDNTTTFNPPDFQNPTILDGLFADSSDGPKVVFEVVIPEPTALTALLSAGMLLLSRRRERPAPVSSCRA